MRDYPSCLSGDTSIVRSITAAQRANHLELLLRSQVRNAKLRDAIRELWGQDTVDILRCSDQERLTAFMDMPPVHIGWWNESALTATAQCHGSSVANAVLSSSSVVASLWEFGKCRLETRTRQTKGVPRLLESISFWPLRGALKRSLAIVDCFSVGLRIGSFEPVPTTTWFHMMKPPTT
jgi:hypothetical protein